MNSWGLLLLIKGKHYWLLLYTGFCLWLKVMYYWTEKSWRFFLERWCVLGIVARTLSTTTWIASLTGSNMILLLCSHDGSILFFISCVLSWFRLGSEFTPQKQLKQEAETIMHQLMTFVHFTAVRIFRDNWLLCMDGNLLFLVCYAFRTCIMNSMRWIGLNKTTNVRSRKKRTQAQYNEVDMDDIVFRFVGYRSNFCSICVKVWEIPSLSWELN